MIWLVAAALAATDFTGVWVLDKAASTSPDALLEAFGASWVERQAAATLSVTQTITQTPEVLTLRIDSAIADRTEELKLSGSWTTSTSKGGDPVRTRTYWEGERLVTVSELTRADGLTTLRAIRTLEEGGATMRQRLEVTTPDGKLLGADRVFRRGG